MRVLEKQEEPIEDDYLMDSKDGLRVSEETYWQKYYHHPDFNYEWLFRNLLPTWNDFLTKPV